MDFRDRKTVEVKEGEILIVTKGVEEWPHTYEQLIFNLLFKPKATQHTGIGELKINMTLAQVEKIIGQAIALPGSYKEKYAFDFVTVNYKGIKIDLKFYEGEKDDKGKPIKMI